MPGPDSPAIGRLRINPGSGHALYCIHLALSIGGEVQRLVGPCQDNG